MMAMRLMVTAAQASASWKSSVSRCQRATALAGACFLAAACGSEASDPTCSELPTSELRRACAAEQPPDTGVAERCGDGIVNDWTPPRVLFDFENAEMPRVFDGVWLPRPDSTVDGLVATHPPLRDNEMASMSWTAMVYALSTVSFDRRVSSEQNYDYLRFYVDGVEFAQWAGEIAWAQERFEVSAGEHLFEWRYSKDGSISRGADAAFVDNILLEASEPLVEECDDGNTESGDGCSAWCVVE